MQQQQPTQPHSTLVPMPQLPPTNITTEQIQKYLDENKQLILAILDNQNLGKLSECAQYQAQLQRNLLYLAAIADAQPQTPAVRAQMLPHAAMQQGGHYMPQPSIFPPKATSIPFTAPPQHMPEQHHQFHPQPQLLGGHMAVRPGGFNNGMHMVAHGEAAAAATLGGAGSRSGLPPPSESEFPPRVGPPSSSLDGRCSRQDATAASESNAAPAAGEHGGGGVVEAPSMKRPPEGKTP